jgi:hypothetical protein
MKRLVLILPFWVTVSLYTSYLHAIEFNQIGEWSKLELTQIPSHQRLIHQKAQTTAKILGATGFYLGKFAGIHLAITNWHVCPRHWPCIQYPFRLEQIDRRSRIDNLVLAIKEIDLAVLTLDIPNGSALDQFLIKRQQNFSWNYQYKKGTPLLTMGHGVHLNPQNKLKVEFAGNCFLADEKIKMIMDPDQLNSADFQVWSLPTGCDASGNDSGSPFYDLKTGELIGILWTARRPRMPQLTDDSFFKQAIKQQHSLIWNSLTYFVPARAIRSVLIKEIQKKRNLLDPAEKAALLEFIR